MTTYQPADGVYPGRPPCANCGADFHLHRPAASVDVRVAEGDSVPLDGRGYVTGRGLAKLAAMGLLECPSAYRADTLGQAEVDLAAALASGDEARVFVARGNLQRLQGRRRHG